MTSEITYTFNDPQYKELFGKVFEITASMSPFIPAQTYGPPDSCSPAEGGEIYDIEIMCTNKDGLDKIFAEVEFLKLLDSDDKFREKIETLLFENIDYPEPDEDWYL